MTVSKNELAALSLVNQIKQCYEMTFQKADESLDWAIRCGEFLCQAKDHLGHGAFGGFVEQNFDFCQRRAQDFMKLYKDLHQIPNAKRAALLRSAGSIRSLQKLLTDTSHKGAAPAGVTDDLEPDSFDPGEDDEGFTDDQEHAPKPPRNGRETRGGKPPTYSREAYYKQWEQSMGPLVRMVDSIARTLGESRNGHHRDVQEHLNDATMCMREWMEVK